MRIEKVTFGAMIIDGQTYTSDLKIFPDGHIEDQWWRAEGHRLTMADIASLVAQRPALIIVGTGIYGRMNPERELKAALADRGIELVTAWTKAAGDRFNAALETHSHLAACFHLTC